MHVLCVCCVTRAHAVRVAWCCRPAPEKEEKEITAEIQAIIRQVRRGARVCRAWPGGQAGAGVHWLCKA